LRQRGRSIDTSRGDVPDASSRIADRHSVQPQELEVNCRGEPPMSPRND